MQTDSPNNKSVTRRHWIVYAMHIKMRYILSKCVLRCDGVYSFCLYRLTHSFCRSFPLLSFTNAPSLATVDTMLLMLICSNDIQAMHCYFRVFPANFSHFSVSLQFLCAVFSLFLRFIHLNRFETLCAACVCMFAVSYILNACMNFWFILFYCEWIRFSFHCHCHIVFACKNRFRIILFFSDTIKILLRFSWILSIYRTLTIQLNLKHLSFGTSDWKCYMWYDTCVNWKRNIVL